MASWLWGSSTNPQFEELIEKACSPLNLPYPESEDIALNLEICDMIRSKTVAPKVAMQSLKGRMGGRNNGRVQMAALGLTDTCIKNGGDHFLQEIASKEFVDELTGLIKSPFTTHQVKEMAKDLFQQWAIAFESKKELSFLPEMFRELKNSGIPFPPPPTTLSSHLLSTPTPPTWIDSDSCMRCRTPFTFTNRKHHCRNCGLVFDQACSSKSMALPGLGIVQEVRVCESCYAKGGKGGKSSRNDPNTPAIPAKRHLRADQFDADLQRAIALSLAESSPSSASKHYAPSQPPLAGANGRKLEGTDEGDDEDEELRMAIEASLAEMQKVRPSAPGGVEEPEFKPLPTYDLSPRETETMLTFAQTIEHATGFGDHDLRRFPHAHGLHDQASNLAGKLQRNIEEKHTKHQMLSEMHDRLMMAVRRYDSLLTEQDNYTRQQQELRRQENERRFANPYQYAYPSAAPPAAQAGYVPYQAQGYAPPPQQYPAYVPAQAAYAPPAQLENGQLQGMYPAIPTGPAVGVSGYAVPTSPPRQAYQGMDPAQSISPPRQQSQVPTSPVMQQQQQPYTHIPPQAQPSQPQQQMQYSSAPPLSPQAEVASIPFTSYQPPQAQQPMVSNPHTSQQQQQQYAQAPAQRHSQPPQPQYNPPQQQQPQQAAPAFPSLPDAPTHIFPQLPAQPIDMSRQEERPVKEEALLIEL